jgi:hypothetical protein
MTLEETLADRSLENVSGPRDWVADRSHENGNYSCTCILCGHLFVGHKRRNVCKECAAAASVAASNSQTGDGRS